MKYYLEGLLRKKNMLEPFHRPTKKSKKAETAKLDKQTGSVIEDG
jgi:hypothetical protein